MSTYERNRPQVVTCTYHVFKVTLHHPLDILICAQAQAKDRERNEEMRVQITELSDMLNFVEKENEELKTQIRHTRSTSARRDSPRTSGADYRRKCEVLEDRLHAKEIVLQKLTKERDHLENDLSRIRSGGPGTHELLKDVENLEKQNRILEEMCRVYDDALTKAVTDVTSLCFFI